MKSVSNRFEIIQKDIGVVGNACSLSNAVQIAATLCKGKPRKEAIDLVWIYDLIGNVHVRPHELIRNNWRPGRPETISS